jgi:hypothetical protein
MKKEDSEKEKKTLLLRSGSGSQIRNSVMDGFKLSTVEMAHTIDTQQQQQQQQQQQKQKQIDTHTSEHITHRRRVCACVCVCVAKNGGWKFFHQLLLPLCSIFFFRYSCSLDRCPKYFFFLLCPPRLDRTLFFFSGCEFKKRISFFFCLF